MPDHSKLLHLIQTLRDWYFDGSVIQRTVAKALFDLTGIEVKRD